MLYGRLEFHTDTVNIERLDGQLVPGSFSTIDDERLHDITISYLHNNYN